MHWVIRWADAETDQDLSTVIEAATRDEAESLAAARGIPTIFVARASQSDIAESRRAPRPRPARAHASTVASAPSTPTPGHTCLGRPLGRAQLAALMLAGVATALLHLRPILPTIMS